MHKKIKNTIRYSFRNNVSLIALVLGTIILLTSLVINQQIMQKEEPIADIRSQAACWCTGQDQCPSDWNWDGGEGYCLKPLKCCTTGPNTYPTQTPTRAPAPTSPPAPTKTPAPTQPPNLCSGYTSGTYWCNGSTSKYCISTSTGTSDLICATNFRCVADARRCVAINPTATPTRTPTPSPQPTSTPRPTQTPVPTNTSTPQPTATNRPVQPTNPPSTAPTNTPTRIPTKTPTKTPTRIPTRVSTLSPTRIPTKVPSTTPTPVKGSVSSCTQIPQQFCSTLPCTSQSAKTGTGSCQLGANCCAPLPTPVFDSQTKACHEKGTCEYLGSCVATGYVGERNGIAACCYSANTGPMPTTNFPYISTCSTTSPDPSTTIANQPETTPSITPTEPTKKLNPIQAFFARIRAFIDAIVSIIFRRQKPAAPPPVITKPTLTPTPKDQGTSPRNL